jgi:hypothetical protein
MLVPNEVLVVEKPHQSIFHPRARIATARRGRDVGGSASF